MMMGPDPMMMGMDGSNDDGMGSMMMGPDPMMMTMGPMMGPDPMMMGMMGPDDAWDL